VVQAAIVGGYGPQWPGRRQRLTYLFLDVMEEAGLRDPNYQARVHAGSPAEYGGAGGTSGQKGNAVPALFGDGSRYRFPLELTTTLWRRRATTESSACVELALPGKSFFSTDAGLFNLPLCLELALNQGKRFKEWPQDWRGHNRILRFHLH